MKHPQPVSSPIPGKDMIRTSDRAGYVFATGDWAQLERFLILGADSGTFYAGKQTHGMQNCDVASRCIAEDGVRAVRMAVEISDQGRGIKNAPSILVLAMASAQGNDAARAEAHRSLAKVCRIPTDLFQFCETVDKMRSWGYGLMNAVSSWYLDRPAMQLAYQLTKYPGRTVVEGDPKTRWDHSNVLHMCHPYRFAKERMTPARALVLRKLYPWKQNNEENPMSPPPATVIGQYRQLREDYDRVFEFLDGLADLRTETNPARLAALIHKHNFVREHLPTEALQHKAVWEALMANMPLGALMRNLGKLTSLGLLGVPFKDNSKGVVERITSEEYIKHSRVHPAAIMLTLRQYGKGHGDKGSLTWSPDVKVMGALDDAFYKSFNYLPPTGKNFLIAVDVSGSMSGAASCWADCTGAPGVAPREAAACIAMVVARVEQNHHLVGFSNGLVDIPIHPRDRLETVIDKMSRIPMGGTDCSAPIVAATANKWPVDCFVSITDNETNCGVHPSQALEQFRQKSGRDAKAVVGAMVANNRTIFDPNDMNSLMVVGFDTNVPKLISAFAGGQPPEADDTEEG